MFNITKIKVVVVKRARDILLALSIGSIAKFLIDGGHSIDMVMLFIISFGLTIFADLIIMRYDNEGGKK